MPKKSHKKLAGLESLPFKTFEEGCEYLIKSNQYPNINENTPPPFIHSLVNFIINYHTIENKQERKNLVSNIEKFPDRADKIKDYSQNNTFNCVDIINQIVEEDEKEVLTLEDEKEVLTIED